MVVGFFVRLRKTLGISSMNEKQYEMHMANRMRISRSSSNLRRLYSAKSNRNWIQISAGKGYLSYNTSSGVVLSLLDESPSS